MRRAIVYLDGRNIYYSLEEAGIDGYNFDYMAFVKKIVGDREIAKVKYFGARYPREVDQAKHNRDDAFFQYITGQGISFVEGNYKINEDRRSAREKGVDVRLAVELVVDAFYNNFDDAYVCSSDTDIIPAIIEAKKLNDKKVFGVSVCRSPLREFQSSCSGIVNIFHAQAKKFSVNLPPASTTMVDLQNRFNAGRPTNEKKPKQ